ncbi:MAG: hypothetical protein ABFC90_11525 [Bacteroidales bacterium]
MKNRFNLLKIISIIILSLAVNEKITAQTFNYLTIGDMQAEGWTIKNVEANGVLSFEEGAGEDGTKALKASATSIAANKYYVLIGTSQSLNLVQNEYYTISYWAKTTDKDGIELTPWIQVADAAINYPYVYLQSESLTTVWKKFTYTFSNPLPTSNKALFKFRVYATGTILIDNVQIGPADPKDIPVTEIPDTRIYSLSVTQDHSTKEIPVYKSDCPVYKDGYMGMQSKDNIPLTLFQGRSISWANFSFKDSVHVVVKVLNTEKVPILGENVRILPSRYGIKPRVSGDSVLFTLTTAGQFSVEIGDDGYKNGILIFANPPETDVPELSDPDYLFVEPNALPLKANEIPATYKGLYFRKGAYDIGVFEVPANIRNIYLADSTWVYGSLQLHSAKGVRIFGRGILSSAKLNYREAHGIDCNVDSVCVEGIVVADPKFFAVRLMGSHNKISWVKVIGGWVYNCDGITGYTDSNVSHCFIWANDDAIKVYLSNIVWSDCVVWQLNNGGVIQISWGRTQADNCRISRIDVLRAEWVKAGFNCGLLSCVGNHYDEADRYSIQKNWIIEDIVTENPIPIVFGINPDDFSPNDVRNFTLRNWNVKMTMEGIFKNKIVAGHPNTILDGFIFDHVVFNDTLLTADNWLRVTRMDTSGFAMPQFLPILNSLPQVKSEYEICPNPVEDTLIIEGVSENSSLKVYSANSILVATGNGRKLSVSTLPKGIYLLLADGSYKGKFVKK